MKKIKEILIKAGLRKVNVQIFKINNSDKLQNLSRVYIIAVNQSKKVPLIYNSKRNIWGFPGGHIEKGESVNDAALREGVEEIKKTIKNCESRFMLVNKIDETEDENQIICFATIGENSTKFQDKHESVKEVVYVEIDEVIQKIGNRNLWEPIISELKNWID